jgi:DNA-binding NtrC family response regulator
MRKNADILWVDDSLWVQTQTIDDIKRALSVRMTFASTISVAKSTLDKGDFKIIILDMHIDKDSQGGLTILRYMSEQADAKPAKPRPWVIVYTGDDDGDHGHYNAMFPNFIIEVVPKHYSNSSFLIRKIKDALHTLDKTPVVGKAKL